ncbi:DUF2271 domain-containing protein [bacterium]|nr:DUF2271 domain-containing protein [bacterium]RQV98656.1 MAG: DUF2271 domain-containing protein [bacterium]
MIRHFLLICFVIMVPLISAEGDTSGLVEISFTTKATEEKYSPQHVHAIWVTDTSGNFVKTLGVSGQVMKLFLSNWIKSSEGNTIDAITTATLKKHQTHTVTWDCRDVIGKIVPDGIYRIHIEFTEENRQGPVTPPNYLEFKKGDESVSLNPEDLTYFYHVKFVYKPEDQSD